MFELGLVFALISAFSFAISNIASKKLSTKTTAFNSVLYSGFFITLFAFLAYMIFSKEINFPNNFAIFGILIGGISGFFGILYLFKSFQNLDVGKTLIIANTYPFIILILSTLILSDPFNFFIIFPMILIFIGIILLFNIKNKNESFKKLKYPILVSLNWGVFYFCITFVSRQNVSEFATIFYIETIVFLTAIIYGFLSKKLIIPKTNLKNITIYSSLSGLFVMLGITFVTFSQNLINPAITSSVKSFELIITAILASFLFKEILSLKNIFGIIIAFSGIILFNFI